MDHNTGDGLYWSSLGATPVTLKPLLGLQGSFGYKINDAGVIIGASYGNGVFSVAVWSVDSAGVPSDPLQLPLPPGDTRGQAISLSESNAAGVSRIVGYSGSA